ncbi:MAG: hypothetical protein EHM72_07270 [Calditrichaeota bacterium]|nr:MAG: hypothetical protein EHM72_07270 [Calditrichota bacterium]
MIPTKENLVQVIKADFDQLVIRICNRLQKISLTHYENIDFERHQEREEAFLSLICDALADQNDEPLKNHMIELANIRHNEGYALAEVQSAIDTIEDELWDTVIACGRPPDIIINMLHEVHRLMVLMRNQFAVSYAEKQVDVQKRMAKLKERFFIYRHDRQDLEKEKS